MGIIMLVIVIAGLCYAGYRLMKKNNVPLDNSTPTGGGSSGSSSDKGNQNQS